MPGVLDNQERRAFELVRALVAALPREFVLFGVAALSFATISLLPPQLFYFFTRSVASGTPELPETFVHSLVVFGFLIALSMGLAAGGRAFMKEWLALRLERHLRRNLLRHLHDFPGDGSLDAHRGEWISTVSLDTRMTEEFLGITLPEFVYSAASVIGTAVILFFYTGWVALLPLAGAVAIGAVNYRSQKQLFPALKAMRQLHSGIHQLLLENLEGWKTVRNQGAASFEQVRIDSKLAVYNDKGAAVARTVARILALNELTVYAVISGCLGLSAAAVAAGKLSVESALFYPFYLGQFFFSVRGIVLGTYGWSRFVVHGARLSSRLKSERAPVAAAETIHENIESLDCRHLGFGHTEHLVRDATFCLSRGELVVVLGRSGSGKSTLLDVVAGLRRPLEGSMTLVDKSGKRLPADFPASLCGLVDQKPYLFEGSVASNLTMGRPCGEPQIQQALEAAGVANEVRARGGIAAPLADRGANFSEGQRYRLAMARALLLDRPFLLLDEPFASLDDLSIAHLTRTLTGLRRKAGILVVTHYLPDSLQPDRVYSIDRGQLRERQLSTLETSSPRNLFGESSRMAVGRPVVRVNKLSVQHGME